MLPTQRLNTISQHVYPSGAGALLLSNAVAARHLFETGDKVTVVGGRHSGRSGEILAVDETDSVRYKVKFDTRGDTYWKDEGGLRHSAYKHFRFTIVEVFGANTVQLTALELWHGEKNIRMSGAMQVRTNAGPSPTPGEDPVNVFNGTSKKWLGLTIPGEISDKSRITLEWTMPSAVVVDGMRYITGNDEQGRDPKRFKLEGSNDGSTWAVIVDCTSKSISQQRKRGAPTDLFKQQVDTKPNLPEDVGNLRTNLCDLQDLLDKERAARADAHDKLAASVAELKNLWEQEREARVELVTETKLNRSLKDLVKQDVHDQLAASVAELKNVWEEEREARVELVTETKLEGHLRDFVKKDTLNELPWKGIAGGAAGGAAAGAAAIALAHVKMELNKKADKTYVTAEFDKKAAKTAVDSLDKKPSFFTLYKTFPEPEDLSTVLTALQEFVDAFGKTIGASDADKQAFRENLEDVATSGSRPSNYTEVGYAGARLWSHDATLAGYGLYSMLAKVNRDDNTKLLVKGGITLQKAINAGLVNRGSKFQTWPGVGWNHKSHRGSGIPRAELAFWRKLSAGDFYRIPSPMATSIRPGVAEEFLARVSDDTLEKVHFVFEWESGDNADNPCLHARYIEAVTSCAGEEELLLSGYSAVQFVSMEEMAGRPIKITLKVCRDNKPLPEYLPLARWH